MLRYQGQSGTHPTRAVNVANIGPVLQSDGIPDPLHLDSKLLTSKVGEVLKTTNTVSTFQKACAACGARKTEESYGDTHETDGKHNIFDLLSFSIFGPNTVITVS